MTLKQMRARIDKLVVEAREMSADQRGAKISQLRAGESSPLDRAAANLIEIESLE